MSYQVMEMNEITWKEFEERVKSKLRARRQVEEQELAKEIEKEPVEVGEKPGETNGLKKKEWSTCGYLSVE